MERRGVAIVDYGMGNLFSVKHACEQAGLAASITGSKREVLAADAVILPGVGAFGDAMESLGKLDLVGPIRDIAESAKPLIGICLGMQLFMTESCEFGRHRGLGIIEGPVLRFSNSTEGSGLGRDWRSRRLKVPQVGWNRIFWNRGGPAQVEKGGPSPGPWSDSLLAGLDDGAFMYFVHSFYAAPEDSRLGLSTSEYGETKFCSSLTYRNVFACQFHPERSGPDGLQVYRNLASLISDPGSSWAGNHA